MVHHSRNFRLRSHQVFRSELLEQQTALFHKTVAANKVLSARVDELEREVGVWKLGLKNSDDEKSALQKEAEKLNRIISSFKVQYPPCLRCS